MSRLNAASSPLHLANTLLHLGRLDEALAAYDRALKIEPHNLEAIHNRGRTLLRLNRPADAVNCFQQVLKILPNHPTVLLDHGNALRALGEFAEALVSYGRALRFEPKNANAHNDRARALLDLNRPEEALAGCERALGINPHHAMALTNHALALMRLDRHEEALAAYLALQRLHPDSVAAHWGESLCCLLMGYLQRGFGKFSWRFRAHSYLAWKPGISVSFWEGEDIRGKTVLLICEQGYGDMLQFVRYATLVAQCGAEVIIIAPQALERLLWSVPGVARVVGDGEPIPRFHFACWMMDLPNLFRTRLDTIPVNVPYLYPEQDDIARWQRRLARHATTGKMRVGLVWAGIARKGIDEHDVAATDARRSVRLEQLAPLLQVDGVAFYSLQLGEPGTEAAQPIAGTRLINHTANLEDFADTAALILNLDLIISVDTSVAHLGGALGKPVWLLNRFDTCWRWLRSRNDSPWYPTMRLFRQPRPGDWNPAIEEAAQALQQWAWEVAKREPDNADALAPEAERLTGPWRRSLQG